MRKHLFENLRVSKLTAVLVMGGLLALPFIVAFFI